MRICSGAGCLRTVPDRVRFCDECSPTKTPNATDGIREHSNAYDADLDKLRTSPRWQRVRKAVVQRDPICKRCDTGLTEEVDHIVPAREAIAQARASGKYPLDRWAGYFFKSNLQGLCRKCHRAKTLEDKAHVGEWPDVIAKEATAPKKVWTF